MRTFHILYYEKPADEISKGIDIKEWAMVQALQAFNRVVEHDRIVAIFDKEAFMGTVALADDNKLMQSADALHKDQEYKTWKPKYEAAWEISDKAVNTVFSPLAIKTREMENKEKIYFIEHFHNYCETTLVNEDKELRDRFINEKRYNNLKTE